MRLTDEMQEVVDYLRGKGWAICLVSPEVLDGTPREWVESRMAKAAQEELEHFDGEGEGNGE